MDNIIMHAITLGVMVLAFLAGKYIFPNVPKTVVEKLNDLGQWAEKFVVWAREFMKTSTGREKMEKVVEQLQGIAEEAGLNVTEDQLKAIAQSAYEAMMAGEKEAAQTGKEAAAPAATVIIHNGAAPADGTTAILTDNVPDGALDENPDGTVNVYNSAGEQVGTMDKTEAKRIAEGVEVIAEEITE